MLAISGGEFRRLMVSALFHDVALLPSIGEVLDPAWFPDAGERFLIEVACSFYRDFRGVPGEAVVASEIAQAQERGKLTEDEVEQIITLYNVAVKAELPAIDQALFPYIRQHSREFARYQALSAALVASASDLRQDRFDDIIPRLQKALAIGVDVRTQDGNLVVDRETWLAQLARDRGPVWGTGIDELDAQVGGGLHGGEVGVFIGTTGSGKSHALVNAGRAAALTTNVLHVTLEMSRLDVLRRYASNITGIKSQLIAEERGMVLERLADVGEMWRGGVVVLEYPTRSLTVQQLSTVVGELDRREGFKPGLVVVDYATIMAPPKSAEREAQWVQIGLVFEQLRSLAMQYQVPVWTAAQFNRTAIGRTDPDLGQMGGSYEPAKIADLIIAIAQSAAEKNDPEGAQLRLVPVKARHTALQAGIAVRLDGATSSFKLVDSDDGLASAMPRAKFGSWVGVDADDDQGSF